eukprot:7756072-Pyramimonas_sp.AAC.2
MLYLHLNEKPESTTPKTGTLCVLLSYLIATEALTLWAYAHIPPVMGSHFGHIAHIPPVMGSHFGHMLTSLL